jgi:hypothetical protein
MPHPSDIIFTREVVIHGSFGGFLLSDEAKRELARRKGWTLHEADGYLSVEHEGRHYGVEDFIRRDDADLIDIVRTMGKAAGKNDSTDLRIITVEVNIDIESHDGREDVHVWGYRA